jgi:hypothetical protein
MQPVLTLTDSGEKVLLLADEHGKVLGDQEKREPAILGAQGRQVGAGEVADQGEV